MPVPGQPTTAEYIARQVIPAAYALLPPRMATPPATAMLLAIGLQESAFKHRRQVGGPARGFWQFEERGGVLGVLQHRSTQRQAHGVIETLRYSGELRDTHEALEHNDVLACAFARLLLWTVPRPLALSVEQAGEAWQQYLEGWRPGRPHPDTWAAWYAYAWELTLTGGI